MLKKLERNLPATLTELHEYILIGREALKAAMAKIRAIDKVSKSKAAKEAALLDTQDAAEYLLCAEVKLGEMLKIQTSHGGSLNYKSGASKSLPVGVSHKDSHFAQQLATHQDIVEKVIAKAKEEGKIPTSWDVLKEIKNKERDNRIKNEKTNLHFDIDLRKGDFKDVLDDVYNIDAIITDPPYPQEYLQCFSDLSKYASTHLKPNGFLVVYSGQYHLPEVIQRLSEHLIYVWTFCLYHVGKKQIVNGVNVMCGWKPILIFAKQKQKMLFSAYDVVISEEREKDQHEWQQSKTGVVSLIDIFTVPGETIVDPFSGSGTFLRAAHEMGRVAIGSEINDTI